MSAPGPAPRRGPRPRFTREDVFAAALKVIDAGSPEAFTMRAVANELGVGAMTLYGYVDSKDEILEGVTVLVYGQERKPPPEAADWREQLRAEMQAMHAVGREHPNLVALVLAQTAPAPAQFRMRERMLATLLGAGFGRTGALHALGVLTSYVLGFSGAQARSAPIEHPETLRALPAADFPHLSAAADDYDEHLSDDAFDYGLDLLIAGLSP